MFAQIEKQPSPESQTPQAPVHVTSAGVQALVERVAGMRRERDGLSLLGQWLNLQMAVKHGLVTQREVTDWCAGLSPTEVEDALEELREFDARIAKL